MLNLTKKINKLVENTSSLECKEACKEVVEMFHSVPEEQLTIALVEKLKGIKDADKHVQAFVKSATKTMKLKDLGVAKAISKIRESQVYHYPALRYSLDRFERAKINEGVQDYLIVEEFLTSLKDFVWDKNVKDSLDEVKEQYEADRESILVSKALFEFRKAKGNFLFEKVCQMLEDHFENPTDASRSSLIESLVKFSFSPVAKSLGESLKKIQSSSKKSLEIIAENANCDVNSVYSTIFLENEKEYFSIKGDLYKKNGSLVEKVTTEEFQSLSENVKRSYQILNSPYFFVKEGKASFYVGRNKVEIMEGENATKVLFNGKTIASSDIAKNLVSTGMIRLEEAKVASDIQFVNDTFSNFFELDFAKVISSKIYEGSYVALMKVNEKIYLNKVNKSMRSNEFFSDLNATQARNIVLEFLGYDIKESMAEFIEKDEAEIQSIREQQTEVIKNMTVLEGEITKIEAAKRDSFMASQPQIQALSEMLNKELTSLKEKYSQLSARLKKFEAKSSDAGLEIGEDVKINDTDEMATITAIDSNTKKVSVVTSEGKTKEFPLNKVSSMQKEEAVTMKRNEKKAEEESKKEPVEAVEEATANLAAGGNEMPVENPNKDQFPAQEPQAEPAKVENTNPEYVMGKVDVEHEGSCAGKDVEVLASDFAAKGPEDLIQVKCEGELYFIEKKYIHMAATEAEDSLSIDFDAEAPSDDKKEEPKEEVKKEEPKEEEKEKEEPKEEEKEEPKEEEKEKEEPKEEEKEEEKKPSVEELQSKLAKALKDLEEIKNDMKDTFTSNETISTTINGLRGLADALKKDLNESK